MMNEALCAVLLILAVSQTSSQKGNISLNKVRLGSFLVVSVTTILATIAAVIQFVNQVLKIYAQYIFKTDQVFRSVADLLFDYFTIKDSFSHL